MEEKERETIVVKCHDCKKDYLVPIDKIVTEASQFMLTCDGGYDVYPPCPNCGAHNERGFP